MSQFKTFLLPLEPDATAEEDLNSFLRGHRIVDVQRLCVPARGWCFCVEWLEGAPGRARGLRFGERIDYMKELEPAVFSVFSKLRTRRKELARDGGVPPFSVATDVQLAEMAKMEAPTLAKIAEDPARPRETIVATGRETLRPDDRLVVFGPDKALDELSD